MLAHLQVVSGPDMGRSFDLEEGRTLTIGRGPNTGTQLKDMQVSRVHCELQVAGGKFLLVDNGSAGGTRVNGEPIEERELKPGDAIQLGGTTMKLVAASVHHQATVAPGPSPKPKPAAQAPAAGLVGTTLSHYEILAPIAKGHSGAVYKARDTRDGKAVALKVLGPEYAVDEEEFQRFTRAVKTVVGLKHENLVAVYGAGKTGSNCWIAMEFVDGESLTKVIGRIGAANMLDWRYALTVAVQVGRALEAAHERHIIHRNVTPANILIRNGDHVAKLGDLILAKALEGTMARQVTRPGQILGEVAYLPPERTQDDAPVDERSDLYSLGATCYALLTGHPPFEGKSLLDTITKIRTAEPVKPKKYQLSIVDGLQDAVLKLIAKRPEDRYQSAAELVRDLERVAKYQGMTL